jgi:hypothetical protein
LWDGCTPLGPVEQFIKWYRSREYSRQGDVFFRVYCWWNNCHPC